MGLVVDHELRETIIALGLAAERLIGPLEPIYLEWDDINQEAFAVIQGANFSDSGD